MTALTVRQSQPVDWSVESPWIPATACHTALPHAWSVYFPGCSYNSDNCGRPKTDGKIYRNASGKYESYFTGKVLMKHQLFVSMTEGTREKDKKWLFPKITPISMSGMIYFPKVSPKTQTLSITKTCMDLWKTLSNGEQTSDRLRSK